MALFSFGDRFRKIPPLLAAVPLFLLLLALPFFHMSAIVTIVTALVGLGAILFLFRRRGRNSAALMFIILSCAWIWQAHFTWQGYFWVNGSELEQLAHKISDYGKIRSLSMGKDGSYRGGDGVVHYDAYRTLNGVRVTHYPHNVDAEGLGTGIFIDDYCRENDISPDFYYELRQKLEILKINGFSVMDNGDIYFNLWMQTGVSRTINLIRIDDGTHPLDGETLEKLGERWYIATIT